jgi:hypothetical protein
MALAICDGVGLVLGRTSAHRSRLSIGFWDLMIVIRVGVDFLDNRIIISAYMVY